MSATLNLTGSAAAPIMPTAPGTIAVAMSGGVDSSAVAALLSAQGQTIIGLTLQLWNQRRLAGHEGMPESVKGRCCSIDDVYDARSVAGHLGIPYYLVNQEARFEAEVVKPFVAEYLAGRTPIPCTLCNNHLKFDALLQTARQIGATHVATGHYARNHFDPVRQRWILSRPADSSKDQTYFLFGLTQDQLAHTLFPLGEMQKPAVRRMAEEAGLALAQKPDSQEICFIPGGDYSAFLRAYLENTGEIQPDLAGNFVSPQGEVLGRHAGIQTVTVGQRKGLGLSSPSPLYVLNILPETRTVTVGPETDLMKTELYANRLNWISIPHLSGSIRIRAKIRHRHEAAWANVESVGNDLVRVQFDEPQRAITPGQAVIFFDGLEVVGGGWITNPWETVPAPSTQSSLER